MPRKLTANFHMKLPVNGARRRFVCCCRQKSHTKKHVEESEKRYQRSSKNEIFVTGKPAILISLNTQILAPCRQMIFRSLPLLPSLLGHACHHTFYFKVISFYHTQSSSLLLHFFRYPTGFFFFLVYLCCLGKDRKVRQLHNQNKTKGAFEKCCGGDAFSIKLYRSYPLSFLSPPLPLPFLQNRANGTL